jgi:hypothetical protein
LKGPVLGVLGAAAARVTSARAANVVTPAPPPGSPPAFGTGPVVGPAISPATIAEAEKLVQVTYTAAERTQAAGSWQVSLAPLYERRTGPRKLALEPTVAPATQWNPVLPGITVGPARNRFVRGTAPPGKLPPGTRTSRSRR